MTLEVCCITGMLQPAYLRDDEDLEVLIARRHRPRRFAGSLVLFGSEVPRSYNQRSENWGWTGLATAGIRRVAVPGNHLEMLHRPEVTVLGARIAASIDEAVDGEPTPRGTAPERE
jgi:thioesterase domain-containing protein